MNSTDISFSLKLCAENNNADLKQDLVFLIVNPLRRAAALNI